MKQIAWLFKWLLKAAIFFTLFAFALNNQGDTTVHFFFGYHWTAPMVLVVLVAFATGLVIGVLGMVPRWWRHRREALQARFAAREATNALSAEASKQGTPPRPDGL
ncbi:MAG: LapA family protein [Burkholderiales bacterium]|nr:LapA family protein [Burkholderiales bacterium]